jgi:DNA mismatch repair protein MutH
LKSEEENLEAVQQYFGYSFNKAKEALRLLTPENIEEIKGYLKSSKGGKL